MLKRTFKHFHTINKHRWHVFRLCLRCGIGFQGLFHDLSKYSPIEFFEGIKYFSGDKSPIVYSKIDNGYSKAWLHHKGRNKHHHEYWYDYAAPSKTPLIPYKYLVEMICDDLAASIVYNGKSWHNGTQYEYWSKMKDRIMLDDRIKDVLTDVYSQVKEQGIKKTITKQNIDKIYKKYINSK